MNKSILSLNKTYFQKRNVIFYFTYLPLLIMEEIIV